MVSCGVHLFLILLVLETEQRCPNYLGVRTSTICKSSACRKSPCDLLSLGLTTLSIQNAKLKAVINTETPLKSPLAKTFLEDLVEKLKIELETALIEADEELEVGITRIIR